MADVAKFVQQLASLWDHLVSSGYFSCLAHDGNKYPDNQLTSLLSSAGNSNVQLNALVEFINTSLIAPLEDLEHKADHPESFQAFREFLERIMPQVQGFRSHHQLIPAYAELLTFYILSLYRTGAPGFESSLTKLILKNIAKRKAPELSMVGLENSLSKISDAVTVAVIAKRYAVYVLAMRGFNVLFRSEVEFRTFGTSPEGLALQIGALLLKNGIKLSDVTDVVCGGGDLGTLPDGIYVLTNRVREESWRHLHNSSLNRGALVTWELRNLLRPQRDSDKVIHSSLCSPLSFSTLTSQDLTSLFREDSRELQNSLKGHVKVTPLKSLAALISEIQGLHQENLNMLVMSLDELFASAARKTGPKIVRELAAQDANRSLINYDFNKIVDHLKAEGFTIPPHFRLASREIGTGVKEICELLMIVNSGMISSQLGKSLMQVVDSYARQIAMILEMSSAGEMKERPHFIIITSMMALDPFFQQLFGKIRARIDNPFTPVMCLDSLEHEYLIADHLFELYINPAGDRRLHYTLEERSMKQALQVLESSSAGQEQFSFPNLLENVTRAISEGRLKPAKVVLVGGENHDALIAVADAKEHGLVSRIVIIGNPQDVEQAIAEAQVGISPHLDSDVEILGIDPLAVDYESKNKATAKVFHDFLHENPDYVVLKGSIETASLLKEALSIYKGKDETHKRPASHTAIFVLPDGRLFALSDAAVNPGFRNAEALVDVIENQTDVVRSVAPPDLMLKTAIITAVEKETSAIPATLLAGEAEKKAKILETLRRKNNGRCQLYGGHRH